MSIFWSSPRRPMACKPASRAERLGKVVEATAWVVLTLTACYALAVYVLALAMPVTP